MVCGVAAQQAHVPREDSLDTKVGHVHERVDEMTRVQQNVGIVSVYEALNGLGLRRGWTNPFNDPCVCVGREAVQAIDMLCQGGVCG